MASQYRRRHADPASGAGTYAGLVSDEPAAAPAVAEAPAPGGLPRAQRPPIDLAAALRQAGWVDALCLGGILVSIVKGYVTLPLAPVLLRHVLPHLLITGSITALLTGGAAAYDGQLPFAGAVFAGVVGIAMFDGFYFWAGRRYGDHVAHFLETYGKIRPRTVARCERWVERWAMPLLVASPFLPVPSVLVYLLTGASGLRWRWFVLFDLIGWAVWCAMFVTIGYAFHSQVDHIARLVTHYSRISTFVLIGVVIALGALRSARQSRTRSS